MITKGEIAELKAAVPSKYQPTPDNLPGFVGAPLAFEAEEQVPRDTNTADVLSDVITGDQRGWINAARQDASGTERSSLSGAIAGAGQANAQESEREAKRKKDQEYQSWLLIYNSGLDYFDKAIDDADTLISLLQNGEYDSSNPEHRKLAKDLDLDPDQEEGELLQSAKDRKQDLKQRRSEYVDAMEAERNSPDIATAQSRTDRLGTMIASQATDTEFEDVSHDADDMLAGLLLDDFEPQPILESRERDQEGDIQSSVNIGVDFARAADGAVEVRANHQTSPEAQPVNDNPLRLG